MEERLAKLFKAINVYTERSKKNYIDFQYDSQAKEIVLSVRDKGTYMYKQEIKSVLDDSEFISIEEIIEKLEGK